MSGARPASPEVVVYVPAGGHPATEGVARGSAIVGRPDPGSEEVTVHFEGAIHWQADMGTLADRALHAYERLRDAAPTVAARTVPREALVVVGTFHPRTGRIILTGEVSAEALAAWLGVFVVTPADLRPSDPRPDLHGGAA